MRHRKEPVSMHNTPFVLICWLLLLGYLEAYLMEATDDETGE